MATGTLNKSDQNTTMDAAYGSGWYFTDLDTDKCDMAVMRACWLRTDVPERMTHYLKFEIHESVAQKRRANVYHIEVWDNTKMKHLGGGTNRVCPKKPCHTCETGMKYL